MCIITAHGDSPTLDLGPRDTILSAARQPTLEDLCASRICQSKEFDTFAGRPLGRHLLGVPILKCTFEQIRLVG
jgi:hypothetical protein